jgi:hypothetical protein
VWPAQLPGRWAHIDLAQVLAIVGQPTRVHPRAPAKHPKPMPSGNGIALDLCWPENFQASAASVLSNWHTSRHKPYIESTWLFSGHAWNLTM